MAADRAVRHDIAYLLRRFSSWCAHSGLPELERLAGTIQAWWPEVLGFLQTQVTNAAAYGSPASGDHVGSPPAEGADPLKFEEPL